MAIQPGELVYYLVTSEGVCIPIYFEPAAVTPNFLLAEHQTVLYDRKQETWYTTYGRVGGGWTVQDDANYLALGKPALMRHVGTEEVIDEFMFWERDVAVAFFMDEVLESGRPRFEEMSLNLAIKEAR